MKILKFGGSSVESPERIRNIIRIIEKAYRQDRRIGIVVSAFGGSTDHLIALGRKAAAKQDFQNELDAFIARHVDAISELIPEKKGFLDDDFHQLKQLLQGYSESLADLLMSFGERLSARIVSEAIHRVIPEAKFLDARQIIQTDRSFGDANVDFAATNQKIRQHLEGFPFVPIIPGFIGSSALGETVTLGRGGSDYSAAIIGAALDVDAIEIWTDVSGIFTADPKKDPKAQPIPEMSYEKAMDMALSGAKVIYSKTIVPAQEKRIPIWIKNSFDPNAPGSLISAKAKIFLAGSGLIGASLLDLMQGKSDLQLIGLANSRRMLIRSDGISIEEWRAVLESEGENMDWKAFIEKMKRFEDVIFVDCTSSQEIADAYEEILASGISIITPNKKANSGIYEKSCELKRIAKKKGVKFLYGANVGGGLPMIAAIQDLVQSGDEILKIEAVLSGSLSSIIHLVAEGVPFDEAVLDAQKKGYTEPNPQEDLSGLDVARKLLILCRESGVPLEMEEIAIAPVSKARLEAVQQNGKRVRYIASFEQGKAKISLQAVGPEHPFFDLKGNDNILAVYSQFYSENPLIIRGPGAGAKVTAGRVLAEIRRSL